MINDPRFAIVGTQMLTPQGMRQRYLLGRHNYQKYNTAFAHEQLLKTGLQVESTDVYRTLQSGYSELMGMVAESKIKVPQLTNNQQQAMSTSGKGLP